MPIFQSSTYEYSGEADYHDVRYIRLNNNPNQIALCKKIAAIENTEAALVAGSGMAAIPLPATRESGSATAGTPVT